MMWLVWREGGEYWKQVWPYMDVSTRAHLEALGYIVQKLPAKENDNGQENER